MDSLSNKVLITGSNGFTGEYLKNHLEKNGYIVFGLSNTISNPSNNIIQCDINNSDELKKVLLEIQPNYIFHLAAISFGTSLPFTISTRWISSAWLLFSIIFIK